MEQFPGARPIEAVFEDIQAHQTHLVELFVPDNADEQREAFLAGKIHNPQHTYSNLAAMDFATRGDSLQHLVDEVAEHPTLPDKYRLVCEEFAGAICKRNRFGAAAALINNPNVSDVEKQAAREEFMQLNVELFGEPDMATYGMLVQQIQEKYAGKQWQGRAEELRNELLALLPKVESSVENFEVRKATQKWLHTVALEFYGNLLRHVPRSKKTKYGPQEIASVFNTVITEEYGEAAKGWRAEVTDVKSIVVNVQERTVQVPKDRKEVSSTRLRGLVVHELGVHLLRSIMGEQTDLEPLRTGLFSREDIEESLAMIMQQAVSNDFTVPGTQFHLVGGLMYFEGKDFRECFEIMWRKAVLEKSKGENSDITDEQIETSRKSAYAIVLRMTRGTDMLPWFKDLAYYSGQDKTWRYIESTRGRRADTQLFNYLFMGKADPTNKAHERVLYETKTP